MNKKDFRRIWYYQSAFSIKTNRGYIRLFIPEHPVVELRDLSPDTYQAFVSTLQNPNPLWNYESETIAILPSPPQ